MSWKGMRDPLFRIAKAKEAEGVLQQLRHRRPESHWPDSSLLRIFDECLDGGAGAEQFLRGCDLPRRLDSILPVMEPYLNWSDRKALLSAVPGFARGVASLRTTRLRALASACGADLEEDEAAAVKDACADYAAVKDGWVRRSNYVRQYMRGGSTAAECVDCIVRDVRREKTCDVRDAELRAELTEWGLKLRGDSKLCAAYIKGYHENLSAQEVACLMKIAADLFALGGHIAYSNFHENARRHARLLVKSGLETWKTAAARVIDERREAVLAYDPFADYE